MRNLLDLKGTIPPFTLLKLTQRFRKLQNGETMEVIGANPDSKKDIMNVLMTLPCKVLHVGNTKSCYFIRLRKLANGKAYKQEEKNGRRHL
jgi:TusA-related sulfurtransferase